MESSVLILLAHSCLLASAEELTVKAGKDEKMVLLAPAPGPSATLLTTHVDRSYGGGEPRAIINYLVIARQQVSHAAF